MPAAIFLCSALLGFTQPGVADESSVQPPAPQVEALSYGAVIDHLTSVDDKANRDPIAAIDALTAAIAILDNYAPELSGDPKALEARSLARLNLARAHLMADQVESATQVMDVAIRAAMGASLPAESFGPSLLALYEQRLAALEQGGYASLVVNCELPCRVFVEQRELDELPPLLLGSYAVWVQDVAGKQAPLREQIELRIAGGTHEL